MIIGTLPNDNQNNLIPIVDEVQGVTTEALTETDTAFSFNIHGGTGLTEGGAEDLPNNLDVVVGLMQRSGTDGPWDFTTADCALWVNWTRGTPVDGFGVYTGLPGTVTEIWGSFGTTLTPTTRKHGRLNVDVGYVRQGPRYTIGMEGANYVGYVDYHGQGSSPRAIVSAPVGDFPFPLRLVMYITSIGSAGASPAEIRDVVLEGKLGEKATLTADNKAEWGVDSDHLHLRIYQLGIVNGFPVDIDL